MLVDVALLPQVADPAAAGVLIVIDQIRASTTITTLIDAGCQDVYLAGDPAEARAVAHETDSLLVGELHAVKPPDFDFDNSPSELVLVDLRGRSVVLSTTNGTAVIARLRREEPVLVGCIRNASAVAAAALAMAGDAGTVGIVCAGREGIFVLDDAVAAGVIAERLVELAGQRGSGARLSDGAEAAIRLRRSWPTLLAAMEASDGGVTLRRIGAPEDIAFCAGEDLTQTVPLVRYDGRMRVVSLATVGEGFPRA
ncbi:MAG: 2-phosphosulfolactate phosphatase [Chloroflexi bacterium]|nr:2-phosphosulfolactate phosphatase [Chloroflexota bacterium]